MALRWRVLALLFLVRTTMAFQFQVVGALSPAFQQDFGVGIADIGVLIGLYLAPGMFLAVPGGALGRRFGAKRVVLAGLALMTGGGILMATSDAWAGQVAGRLVAGLGGVLLNVLMTKMVADWFSGREISLSLAVFVMSWPVGIAVALMVLPVIGETAGLTTALVLVAVLAAAGFAALGLLYPSREGAAESGGPASAEGDIRGALLGAVVAAGAIWGIYNGALSTVFSFGPDLFIARGMNPTTAGSTISIILWLLAIVGTFAGFLVDWSGRRYLILVLGNLGFAVAVVLGSRSDHVLLSVIVMGAFSGVAVGAMMSLPALVLPPQSRALGMGIFFSVFYLFQMAGPMVAGWVADLTGSVAATYHYAAALLVVSVAILPLYHLLAVRVREATALPLRAG